MKTRMYITQSVGRDQVQLANAQGRACQLDGVVDADEVHDDPDDHEDHEDYEDKNIHNRNCGMVSFCKSARVDWSVG